ncbi:YdcF family protein [Aquamicrobium sp. LC103]|uniref:YdcF family protein n=1 Tax=Aquamicrobium sp. LC103 TaxID=1120658 RepID=UPI00063E70FC|nr:YdcF family protein [Aquamicrobium sp. LC103]TKT76840.1 YdcF family protein [Aquamicrobium sp. LC103]
MFYYLSKIFWIVAQPINLIGILGFAGIVLAFAGWRRLSLLFASASFLILALGAWTSLGALMLHPLEDHFARPDPAPENVVGIIVLGGGFEGGVNLVRGGYELNASGDRFVETAILARRYPQARVVVTGGTGALMLEGEGDADTAPRLLMALGVERDRLVLENRSRNTFENAVFTRELVEPAPGETWLLVTSAFHMPRSIGLFRKAGFDVVPWPADYRTAGNETVGPAQDNVSDSLQNLSLAIREWIGLVAYRLTGRIDTILPEV